MADTETKTATVRSATDIGTKVAEVSSAIAVAAGAAAAGPALPIIAGVLVIATVCAEKYAQNKKLSSLFKQTARLLKKINTLYSRLKAIANKKYKVDIDVSQVTNDITELNDVIARIAGPNTLKEIQENNVNLVRKKSFFSRVKGVLFPEGVIANFREKIVNLSLSFNMLQSEFLIILADPDNEYIADLVTDTPAEDPNKILIENPMILQKDIALAEQGLPTTSSASGGRKTQRNMKSLRRTMKKT